MTPFKQTTAALPSHPVQLTDAERALLNTLHDDDEPRSSSMVRASSGRLFAGPIGPWIYVIDASRIHRHRKTGGDLVIPSPDAAGFLSTKAIGNRIKAKGLQKLRWYCQMCQKQCRDENGFKCHQTSESHLRQMRIFQENPQSIMEK